MAGNIVKWWRQFKQYKQFSGKKKILRNVLPDFSRSLKMRKRKSIRAVGGSGNFKCANL
jgi:hypothetical protein